MSSEVRAALERLQARIDDHNRMIAATRQLLDEVDTGALYDPLADRLAVQLPGELVRRLRELTA